MRNDITHRVPPDAGLPDPDIPRSRAQHVQGCFLGPPVKRKKTMTMTKIALLFWTSDLGHLGVLVIALLRPEAATR